MATKYLIEKSGVPIHFLTGRLGISTYFDRLSGYIKAHNDFGYEYNETMVLESDISIEGAMSTIYKLLDTNVRVKSIFATSDILALGALKALTQRGITVGKDILLIGYDDSQMDQIVTPSLTTIRQPKYEMGVEAAKMLIDQIKGNKGECERITMMPDIIIRETA
jgi:LacI family transcriptional regulator